MKCVSEIPKNLHWQSDGRGSDAINTLCICILLVLTGISYRSVEWTLSYWESIAWFTGHSSWSARYQFSKMVLLIIGTPIHLAKVTKLKGWTHESFFAVNLLLLISRPQRTRMQETFPVSATVISVAKFELLAAHYSGAYMIHAIFTTGLLELIRSAGPWNPLTADRTDPGML